VNTSTCDVTGQCMRIAWRHRLMHVVTAWALLCWFHLRNTVTPATSLLKVFWQWLQTNFDEIRDDEFKPWTWTWKKKLKTSLTCSFQLSLMNCKQVLWFFFCSIYIGEGSTTMPATMTSDSDTLALALATLRRATEIEMMLSMSHHPKWPRQVQAFVTVTTGFPNKRCQCKWSFI
jgi:hypothetical protein